MKIWISHTYYDKEFVGRLSNVLKNEGHDIITLDNTLIPGDYLLGKITTCIAEADVLLLVISKQYSKSNWINTEVGLIIAETSMKKKKIFIPILIDKDIKPPTYLLNYYYIDYANGKPFSENTEQILEAINVRGLPNQNPQIQKSITEALRQREKLLKADKIDYQLNRNKQQSFKTFSLLTIIITLLSSIVIILFFVMRENKFEENFGSDKFNITSFIIGSMTTMIPFLLFTILKRKK